MYLLQLNCLFPPDGWHRAGVVNLVSRRSPIGPGAQGESGDLLRYQGLGCGSRGAVPGDL